MTTEATSNARLHWLLSFSNFAAGMGAFAVIGVLTPVASSFRIQVATAGLMMTVYALVYAVASPLLVSATGRLDRAWVLSSGLTVLAVGAALGAIAPSFGWLLGARALMAVGSGLVTPVTASVAVATAAPEHRGRALSTVYAGFPLAQAAGVPLGAWLGYAFGFRTTFTVIAALATVTALVLFLAVPRRLVVQRTSLATLGSVIASPRLLGSVSFMAFFMAAIFSLYTYLASFLEARHGLGRSGITAMFLVFGVGAMAGNALGGFLTDRLGPVKSLAILCAAQIVVMPLLTLLRVPPLVTGALIATWSVCGWSTNVPQQARLAALDPARVPVLLALHAAAIYIGSSVGSSIGGRVLVAFGHDALGLLGAAFAAAALGSLALLSSSTARAPLDAATPVSTS
jgi:predicted MFS family arabinose efflux permease